MLERIGGTVFLLLIATLISVATASAGEPSAADAKASATWQPGSTHRCQGFEVSLSKPITVTRSKGYLWFPCLYHRADGDLLALATNYADATQRESTCVASWSRDGGLSWSAPVQANYGDVLFARANGDILWLPYYLYHRNDGVGNTYQVIPRGTEEIRAEPQGLVVTGWRRSDKRDPKHPDMSGFQFNGDAIPLNDGSFLATLEGVFAGDNRCSLVAARSTDGVKWHVLSTVADHQALARDGIADDGPSESSICRLKDGRIMAVFRLGSYVSYGQAFSADEGKTWSKAAWMKGPLSVQPSLATLPDGLVALSGGRPGLFVWFNAAGDGLTWEAVDLRANHNAAAPADYIHESENVTEKTEFHHYRHETSSYTQLVRIDETHFMAIYDRGPHGGDKIEKIAPETNSLWVVRIGVTREKP